MELVLKQTANYSNQEKKIYIYLKNLIDKIETVDYWNRLQNKIEKM
jgi:hypothetical protein